MWGPGPSLHSTWGLVITLDSGQIWPRVECLPEPQHLVWDQRGRHNIWEEGFVCHKPGGWVLSRQLRLHNTAYFNTSLNEEQAFQFASQWRAVKEGVREEKCSTAGIPFVFSRRALSDKGVVWKYHCVMWLISHRRYCKWLLKTSHSSAPLLALIHLISII